ncbi:MAG: YhbY family RNA-binding protein [Thermoanaerobaculia bacterium]|nr:YhbY family RNA-binding protein [Thermoanaerobaculia bacterium]
MRPLTSAERKRLRSLAHALKPVVHVGAAGLSDGVIRSIDAALEDHELIKIRFLDPGADKKELANGIAERTGGHLAGVIGHVAILYRPATDAAQRKIRLSTS